MLVMRRPWTSLAGLIQYSSYFIPARYAYMILRLLFLLCISGSSAIDTCDGDLFEARCVNAEEIMMKSARYGRMQLGECISRDYGQLGCQHDALSAMDQLCSGKTECQVPVGRTNQLISQGNTCDNDFTTYLEADFICVRVVQSPASCNAANEIKISGRVGMISSRATVATGCGDLATPWVIEASPGQRINVSLVDFGWTTRDSGGLQPSSQCDVYGYISERRLGMNNTLCGGLARERHVYYSASNRVEIQIPVRPHQTSMPSVMLHYEVVGCPDVKAPDYAWYKRNGSTAVIGCEWSEHSWHLRCEANNWIGSVGNCSSQATKPPVTDEQFFSLSPVMTIGLIVGLGVLVVTLLCILVIGYCCCRRKDCGPLHDKNLNKPFDGGNEGQTFLYYPGRPVPLQGQHTSHSQPVRTWDHRHPGQDKPNMADELLHIWETPLPDPITSPQDDSGVVSEPTYSSLPSRGTMAGPFPAQDQATRVAATDGVKAGDVTWPGTRAFFEPSQGLVTIDNRQ